MPQPFQPSPLYGAMLAIEKITGAPVTIAARAIKAGRKASRPATVRLCVTSGEHRLSVLLNPRKLARTGRCPADVGFDKIADMLRRMLDRALDAKERDYVGACDSQAARRLGD